MWLNADILDAAAAIRGYDIIHNDSLSGIRKHGVTAYIREGIKHVVVEGFPPNVLCISLIDFKMLFVVVYRPQSYTVHENSQLIVYLTQVTDFNELIILGDFKSPHSLDMLEVAGHSFKIKTQWRCVS